MIVHDVEKIHEFSLHHAPRPPMDYGLSTIN